MSTKKSNRGGKREGAGRPVSTGHTTATVRVKLELLPLVQAIKDQYKISGIIPEIKES